MDDPEPNFTSKYAGKVLPQSAVAAPARLTSRTLLGNARELIIEHQGRDYRLRLTQNGKLILTA